VRRGLAAPRYADAAAERRERGPGSRPRAFRHPDRGARLQRQPAARLGLRHSGRSSGLVRGERRPRDRDRARRGRADDPGARDLTAQPREWRSALSRMILRTQWWPGIPVTPPPAWVALEAWYRPRIGVR